MSAFSPFKKAPRVDDSIILPITPMASIFTVILVVLLKSFTQGVSNIVPMETLRLPEITASRETPDGLKIEISREAIVVGDRRIVLLENFELPQPYAEVLSQLGEALTKEHAKATPGMTPRAVLLADEAAPYELVRKVMALSLRSGFADLRLLVANAE